MSAHLCIIIIIIIIYWVLQALGSCSHSGALSQEERETRDGGERDPEHQEALGQNGLQRPPEFQDYGSYWAVYVGVVVDLERSGRKELFDFVEKWSSVLFQRAELEAQH